MSSEISASVGRWEKGARNLQDDVRTVQRLLKAAAEILEAPEIDPKGVDGEISRPPGTSTLWKRSKPFKAVSRARWTELLRQAARRGPCYWESRRNCQPRWKMFRTFLNGFSLFRLFQPRAGKNGLGHLHHRGRVVPACMPAVISTFPRALQSTPLPTAWSRAGRIHFTVKLLPWRLIMELLLLVMERSKARPRSLLALESRRDRKSLALAIWSGFKCLAICCTSNSTTRACRVLLLWPVTLAQP